MAIRRKATKRNKADTRKPPASKRKSSSGMRSPSGQESSTRRTQSDLQPRSQKLSHNAAQKPTQRSGKSTQKPPKKRKPLVVRIVRGLFVAVALCFLTVLILAMTPVFTIEKVDYKASEHVSAEDLQQLAPIADGTTLLSVNPFTISSELKRNPWVAEAQLTRIFPSTLEISVVEKKVLALVETSNSEVAWYLGEDECWIEPAALPTGEGANNAQAILDLATSHHTLLIKDVPDTLNPKAGAKATDPELLGALQLQDGFTTALSDQIALYSAPSTTSYSATLQSGVVIALGDTSEISSKEAVVMALIEKYPNQLTYINVKDPEKPTYRKIENAQTTSGTGVKK